MLQERKGQEMLEEGGGAKCKEHNGVHVTI